MKIEELPDIGKLLAYARTDQDTTSAQIKALESLRDHGTWHGAGKSIGITGNAIKCSVEKVFERYKVKGDFSFGNTDLHIEQAPNSELDVEEILSYKRKIYDKKKQAHDFNQLIQVQVKDSKPIAVCVIGDPHIDDDGTDIIALERDLDIIRNTKGMYAGHLGDLTNNWVGRLARLYANQSTTANQAIVLMEWMLNSAPNLFVINGNHDMWNQGADLIKFVMRSQSAINASHGARIALNFADGEQIRINARHDFKGHSQYNPTHGARKEQLWRGDKDHVYVQGHRHHDGASMIPQSNGDISWSFMVSGYKVIDDYADAHGFTPSQANPSVTLVLNPKAKVKADIVKPFWDAQEGADYLTFIRNK